MPRISPASRLSSVRANLARGGGGRGFSAVAVAFSPNSNNVQCLKVESGNPGGLDACPKTKDSKIVLKLGIGD